MRFGGGLSARLARVRLHREAVKEELAFEKGSARSAAVVFWRPAHPDPFSLNSPPKHDPIYHRGRNPAPDHAWCPWRRGGIPVGTGVVGPSRLGRQQTASAASAPRAGRGEADPADQTPAATSPRMTADAIDPSPAATRKTPTAATPPRALSR
jgi:hypothetical protein